ncbi:hypothetical protein LX81_00693 [Palleronia aestuarii]|uniref:Pyridoxamine 5'-phosphate oxidase N-terminal domain-containing protein n=1 Tax=Palleronia aestuarii TaxID=568105 RepID=A0A2W7QB75_9RHOB|nr:pyridoxamine 5'-phosphate oxidase family protein [Palleronia aestuarii]PZX18999.1 hypothetical protein LX81_00693 [Palleronia aestuarii]
MERIADIAELDAIYGDPVPRSVTKVRHRITPLYARWIAASRFAVLSTVGPEGTDASPRGEDGAVAHVADERTLWLPDWSGNNRVDSLRNIVRDPRASLMFLIPGNENVVRANGRAAVTAEPRLTETFARDGKLPRTVIVLDVQEIYFQCAKAVMRSGLWTREPDGADVPSAGDLLREVDPDFDAEAYDTGYEAFARPRLW